MRRRPTLGGPVTERSISAHRAVGGEAWAFKGENPKSRQHRRMGEASSTEEEIAILLGDGRSYFADRPSIPAKALGANCVS